MSNTSAAAAKSVDFYFPKSSKEFTEEQLLQHMRIPGSIMKPVRSHPLRRSALAGVKRSTKGYQTVFFGAARDWVNDEEGWEEVKPRIRSRGWKGSKEIAMEH